MYSEQQCREAASRQKRVGLACVLIVFSLSFAVCLVWSCSWESTGTASSRSSQWDLCRMEQVPKEGKLLTWLYLRPLPVETSESGPIHSRHRRAPAVRLLLDGTETPVTITEERAKFGNCYVLCFGYPVDHDTMPFTLQVGSLEEGKLFEGVFYAATEKTPPGLELRNSGKEH